MRLAVAQTIDKQLIVTRSSPVRSSRSTRTSTRLTDPVAGAWSQYTLDNAAANENYLAAVEARHGVLGRLLHDVEQRRTCEAVRALRRHVRESGIPYENQLEDSQLFFGDTLDNGTWDLGEWAWVGSPGLCRSHRASTTCGIPRHRHRRPTTTAGVSRGCRHRRCDRSLREVRDEHERDRRHDELTALIAEAEHILADELVIPPALRPSCDGCRWGTRSAASSTTRPRQPHLEHRGLVPHRSLVHNVRRSREREPSGAPLFAVQTRPSPRGRSLCR